MFKKRTMIKLYRSIQHKLTLIEEKLKHDIAGVDTHPSFGWRIITLDLKMMIYEMTSVVVKFFIILTKDPSVSFLLFSGRDDQGQYKGSYYEHKRIRTQVRLFSFTTAVTIIIVSTIVSLTLNLTVGTWQNTFAATYTWTQTNWNSLTANTTGHPAPADWTEYSATTTSITAGSTVTLTATASSTTQTDDGSTNTGFAMVDASMTQTEVSGTGNGASVVLTSTTTASPPWTTMTATPGAIYTGGSLVYPGSGDYIYATAGNNTTTFYRYSIAGNSWMTMTATPGGINSGGDLVYPGSGDYIYATRGSGTTTFYRYSISGDSWTTMASTPGGITYGGDLVYPGSGDYIYATAGGNTTTFYRYSISGDSWTTMASTPGGIWSEGALVYPGSGDYIYATAGNNTTTFYRYSISGDSWTTMAATPGPIKFGADLVYPGSGDYIYATAGNNTTNFYRYSISGDSWTIMAGTPGGIYKGGALAYPASGDYIYATRGNNTTTFYRYAISLDTGWTTKAAAPGTIYYGADLVYPGSGDYIYALKGGGTTFYRYSTSGDSWTTMATTPGSISYGGSLVYPGSGDYIYATAGNNTTTFYRYSISGDSWTTMAATPGGIYRGGSLVYPGSGDYIYATAGNNTTTFYRYSISGDSWTTVAAAPGGITYGGDLVYPGSGDYIYATRGSNSTTFYRYSISGDSWTTMAATPGTIYYGAALVYPGSGDYIYATRGSNSTTFYRYSISGDSWTTMAATPGTISYGGSLVYPGSGGTIYATRGGNTTDFYAFQLSAYDSSGTYTSGAIDLGINTASWGALSWTHSGGQTLTIKARSDADGDFSNATAWGSCSSITNGNALSTGGCVTDGHRYIQYQASLSTADTTVTPSLDDVTIGYNYYPTSQTLTSSPFNSTDTANVVGGIAWTEDTSLPSGTYTALSLRASSSSALIATTDWSTDLTSTTTGCSKVSGVVTCVASAIPAGMKDASGDQWMQYKITESSTGALTPTISDVTLTYVVNAPPELQNITAVQQSDGTILITYETRDPDTTTGANAGYVTPSFAYSTNGGTSFTSIVSDLSAGATTTKAVNESTWNSYQATWTPKNVIDGTYSSSFEIQVTVDDSEAANNTAIATSTDSTLDVKDPIPGATPIVVQASTTPASLLLSATDDSSLQMKTGLAADLSDGSWESYASGSSISLATDPDTVYVQFKDAFSNTSTIRSATTPDTPTAMMVQDTTNVNTTPEEYRLFIAWGVVADPGPGFSAYKIYRSTDGTNYSLLATIADRSTNYYTDSSLSGSTPYYYKVFVEDANGNSSYLTSSISAQADGIQNLGEGGGGSDTIAPIISNISSSNQTTQSITINWTTDELSNSSVGYCGAPCSDYSIQQAVSSYVTSHAVTIQGLTPGTTYNYAVLSSDPSANTASTTDLTFSTTAGPTISGTSVIDVSNSTAQITWNTDIAATGYVVYATTTPPAGNTGGWSSFDTSRNVTLSGLDSGTKYYFYVKSQDSDGNWAYDYNVVDGVTEYYSFTTSSDSSAPVITSITAESTSATTTVISWTTNEPATSQVEYGTTSGAYSDITSLKTSYDTTHFVTLSGLTNQTTYYFRVASVDQSANSASSTESSITTLETQIPASQQTVVVSGGGGSGRVSKARYNSVQDELAATKDELASTKDELATTKESLTSTTAELDTLKAQIVGPDSNDSVDPADVIKLIIEKVTSLTNSVSDGTSLDLTEEDIAPAIESLRQLAGITPRPIVTGKPGIDVAATEATISWKTDKKTNSVVRYAADADYNVDAEDPYTAEGGVLDEYIREHKVTLTNLAPSTTYHFQIKTRTEIGDWITTKDYTFTTLSQFPTISNARVKVLDNRSVAIMWKTNILTDSVIKYTLLKNGVPMEGESKTFGRPDAVNDHNVVLKDLEPANTYDLEILSTDSFGNTAKKKMPPFRTVKDETPPTITHLRTETTVFPGSTTKIQTLVFWDTDEPATSQVFYEEVAGATSSTTPKNATDKNAELSIKHTVVITDWRPGTVYRFRAVSDDISENEVVSKDFMVMTPQKQATVVDLIIDNFSETFGWTKQLGI